MIMMNVLAQFLTIGAQGTSGGSGARATSATASDLFMKSLKYIANQICDVVNMYLIPELVVWNYPTKNFPKLCVRNIGETRDLQMLAAAIANLFTSQAIQPTEETEDWVREAFDMPSYVGAWSKPQKPGQPAADVTSSQNPQSGAGAGNNGKATNGNGSGLNIGGVGGKGAVRPGSKNAGTGNVGKPPSGTY
jgi:hypothetical protein